MKLGENLTLLEKKKLLDQLAFIHQRLTQTSQYFVGEFEIAKDSIVLVTTLFNNLNEIVQQEDNELKEKIESQKEESIEESKEEKTV